MNKKDMVGQKPMCNFCWISFCCGANGLPDVWQAMLSGYNYKYGCGHGYKDRDTTMHFWNIGHMDMFFFF